MHERIMFLLKEGIASYYHPAPRLFKECSFSFFDVCDFCLLFFHLLMQILPLVLLGNRKSQRCQWWWQQSLQVSNSFVLQR